jgi:hypothetical protein
MLHSLPIGSRQLIPGPHPDRDSDHEPQQGVFTTPLRPANCEMPRNAPVPEFRDVETPTLPSTYADVQSSLVHHPSRPGGRAPRWEGRSGLEFATGISRLMVVDGRYGFAPRRWSAEDTFCAEHCCATSTLRDKARIELRPNKFASGCAGDGCAAAPRAGRRGI